MWKSLDVSVTQILREINFGDSRRSESAVFAILEALYFANLVHFTLQKAQKLKQKRKKDQNSEHSNTYIKMAHFEPQNWPTLISRKI